MSKKLAFFIADGFQPLDLFGPLDAFEEVNSLNSNAYKCNIVSFTSGLIKSASGHSVMADTSISELELIDYLIICGGRGIRQLKINTIQQQRLRQVADNATKVISICTGAFLLSQVYSEQALTLTTHWRHCQELAKNCKNTTVLEEPLFFQNGRIWSSAGVLSGVDLALALIHQDYGSTISAQIAKELVVYIQRKGNQKQFSELLAIQSSDSLRLAPLIEWLTHNLEKSISVSKMAEFSALSERQLTRLFKQYLNKTPGQYLTLLRVTQAMELMRHDNRSLQQIARKVGFMNYDSFRRAFERNFGTPPSLYSI